MCGRVLSLVNKHDPVSMPHPLEHGKTYWAGFWGRAGVAHRSMCTGEESGEMEVPEITGHVPNSGEKNVNP